jgi:hypothetical protein
MAVMDKSYQTHFIEGHKQGSNPYVQYTDSFGFGKLAKMNVFIGRSSTGKQMLYHVSHFEQNVVVNSGTVHS